MTAGFNGPPANIRHRLAALATISPIGAMLGAVPQFRALQDGEGSPRSPPFGRTSQANGLNSTVKRTKVEPSGLFFSGRGGISAVARFAIGV
jgi:hypothetical protein